MFKANNYSKSQRGVSMIEAMISILLFAVGALGLVALQYSSVAGAGDNQQRTIAIWKAQELANRIRSNRTQINAYIAQVNNNTLDTIGVDSADNVIQCGVGNFVAPPTFCSDFIPLGGDAIQDGAVCTDNEKVGFDLWEVFCEPITGAAVTATFQGGVLNEAEDGSSGLTDVELVLRQNTVAQDGNDDFAIYMAWLSREGESQKGADAVENIATDFCGRADAAGNVVMTDVDSRLDVYCLRFRP